MDYVVYILYSENADRYYVGLTNNVEKRLATHNYGGKKYTSKGRPWIMIKTFQCADRSEAVVLERRIKKRGIKRYLDEK